MCYFLGGKMGHILTLLHLIMWGRGRFRWQKEAISVKPCSVGLPAPPNLQTRSDRLSRIAAHTFSSTCQTVRTISTRLTVQTLRKSTLIRTATSCCHCRTWTRRRSVFFCLYEWYSNLGLNNCHCEAGSLHSPYIKAITYAVLFDLRTLERS